MISVSKAAELRDQYTRMYNTLRAVQRNEQFHLQQAAKLQSELNVSLCIHDEGQFWLMVILVYWWVD